jgi:hypothetical protein
MTVFSREDCFDNLFGAILVEECSCVLVGKKSVVSILDKLGFWEIARSSCLLNWPEPASLEHHGDDFAGEGVEMA